MVGLRLAHQVADLIANIKGDTITHRHDHRAGVGLEHRYRLFLKIVFWAQEERFPMVITFGFEIGLCIDLLPLGPPTDEENRHVIALRLLK